MSFYVSFTESFAMALPEGMKQVSGFELMVPEHFNLAAIEWLQKLGGRQPDGRGGQDIFGFLYGWSYVL